MTRKDTGTHAWLVLMKAHRALARHAERSITALDLCFSDFAVLEMLLNKGPQKVNDIGRAIALTSGAITTAVDRLETRGLVTRGHDADDRRARVIRLTNKGETRMKAAFSAHSRSMEEATDGLTKSEQATLIALLKKLGKAAQAKLQA